MRVLLPALAVVLCLPASAQSRADPKLSSMHPFTGQAGTTFTAVIRGSALTGASAAVVEAAPFSVTVDRVEPEPPRAATKKPADLVTVRVQVEQGAASGRYPIRLVGRNGISNAVFLHIGDSAVISEVDGTHDTHESAVRVSSLPAVYAGRLSQRGEADYYAFPVEAGQTVTFEVISGLPQTAAGGSAATVANFDPALSIFEPAGSWFDPNRLKQIAHNDEPVWVFGRPTDAHLVHRFERSGTYLLRVEAFAGQGGPDYSYQVKIAPGASTPEPFLPGAEWTERTWTRRLAANRLNELATRGGKPADQPSVETYRASPEGAVFKLPGTIEGALVHPGEAHRARFQLEKPADLAMEVETPDAYPPFFNPVVRLLNQAGEEVATNVFAGKGACSGALTKSLQAKTVVPLRDPGEYTLEIRDATADLAGDGFKYRLQVRPHIPHVGDVRIGTDAVNLAPGEAKTIRVIFDREEGYTGAVAVFVESLPPGVTAAVGADFEPDKDPPPATGKRERYTPRTERAVVVLSAAPNAAPLSQPQIAKLVVRPVADGTPGGILLTKAIYVMVVDKP